MNRRKYPLLAAGALVLLGLACWGGALTQPVSAQGQTSNPEAFTIGAVGYVSAYPEGMTFTIEASSAAGPITRATVFYDFGSPITGRLQADTIDNDNGLITGTLFRYQAGGLIPWLTVNYTWRLTDAAGNAIEVGPQTGVYADHTRQWQHAENDLVRIYWFGLPDWVGEEALDAVDQARERWRLGFPGVELTSRPLVVIYPDLDSFLEWRGEAGSESIRFVGTLREEWNGTVQRVPDQARLDRECGGLDLQNDYDYVVRALARSTVVHELTHFHQQAIGATYGPIWWVEGQATFFEDPVQPYDSAARVDGLVALDALPSLAYGDSVSGSAGTLGPDGCTHLPYDVGATFMQFLRDNYGGYEAHGQITALIAQNTGVIPAIETVTGRSFAALEAEWRGSLGAGPAPTPVPTPTFALPAIPTPVFAFPTQTP